MKVLRRRLRIAVAAWMLFQLVSLSALVPTECCAAHRVSKAAPPDRCHQDAHVAYCPIRNGDKGSCPMHQSAHHPEGAAFASEHGDHGDTADAHGRHGEDPGERCAVRGTCDAPMAALAVLLGNHGIVPASTIVAPDVLPSAGSDQLHESLTARSVVPDGPPPRA